MKYLILIVFIAPKGLAIGILMNLIGCVMYRLKLAKREEILLMLSCTQIAAVIQTIIVIIFSRNTFSMLEGFLQALIEVLDEISILNRCGFSFVTVIFGIYPLVTMIRQRTKKIDNEAQVVTEIVEIGTERKELYIDLT